MKRKTGLFVLMLMLGIPAVLMLIDLRREWATNALIQEIHNKNVPGALAALRNGANPNVRDYSMDKPLSAVARAKLLLAHLLHPTSRPAPDTHPTPLMLIAKSDDCPDNPALMKALLAAGADPDVEDEYRMTPLMQTAGSGDIRLLNVFLTHKVDLHRTDLNGRTALHWAAWAGSLEAIESLLAAGSSLEDRNNAGETPLYEACKKAHIPVVQALLKHHANLNAGDYSGDTPLHAASTVGSPDCVSFLFKAGAEIEARNHSGETALHVAAFYENDAVVQVLLRHHADIFARTADGNTPLDAAQNRETIRLLRQAGGKTGYELDAEKKARQQGRL